MSNFTSHLEKSGVINNFMVAHTCATIRLSRLHWFGPVQRMEENRIPKRVLYMNLGTTGLRGRPRKRWRNDVREDERILSGEGWQEKVLNREEWKKILRTARNRQILHMPMEWNGNTHNLTPREPEFSSNSDLENGISLDNCRSKHRCPSIPMEFRPCLPWQLSSTHSLNRFIELSISCSCS